jgi:hypothetical protein
MRLPGRLCTGTITITSVAEPYHLDPDPDPAFHLNADPDPTFHLVADTNQDSTFNFDLNPNPSSL